MKMKLSDNLTLREMTSSPTAIRLGIDNTPNAQQIANMQELAVNVFQKVRNHFGQPITITSGFRSPRLNAAVGGSLTSDHKKGRAMDIDVNSNSLTNKQIFDYIRANLEFDQLIWEFGTDNEPDWVHVSYNKQRNRKQVLRAAKRSGKTAYIILP